MKLPCGCCEDNTGLTPLPIYNQPGQTSLKYRVGTHAAFLESMIARLSSNLYPELAGLTTRDPGDFSIAMLDAWAMVADVLTFYQERIANEGYLRTATESRSILELARLVGYTPRPGVASSVYLAYELEKDYKEKVEIPAGERVQSLPAPGELPQSFETSEPISARAEWNQIKPRMTRPMDITPIDDKTINVDKIYLKGTSTNLKPNDKILFVFNIKNILKTVNEVNVESAKNITEVLLDKAKDTFVKAIDASSLSEETPKIPTLVKRLSVSPNLQPAGSQFLKREEKTILKGNSSDFITQALVSLNPRISNILFPALSSVDLVGKSQLEGVYVLRLKAPLFGYNALPPKGPKAQFTVSPDPTMNHVEVGNELTFEDISDGEPTTRYWDFGDKSPIVTEQNLNYKYTVPGEYTISLTVGNANGMSTATLTITIHSPPGPL